MRERHYHHRHCEERKARRSNPCHIGCMDCFVAPLLAMTMVIWLATGCATPALWDAAKPEATKPVPSDKITEEELQEKGITYTKHDGYYMVKKTPLEMARDYALLGVGLPFAVAADAIMYIGVPGAILVAYAAGGGNVGDGIKTYRARTKEQIEADKRLQRQIQMQKDK